MLWPRVLGCEGDAARATAPRPCRVAAVTARLRKMAERSETRYAKSGDVSIAYQVIGDGPRDLILVPGVISHVEFFHELPGYTEFLDGLASFARVVVLDKRGNGLSDRVIGASSLEERMDDIRAVMDAVDSERATLFGVSEGGPICLLFAATYPARVNAIVLYETFVCYGGVPGTPTFGSPMRTESSPTSSSTGMAPVNLCWASGLLASNSRTW